MFTLKKSSKAGVCHAMRCVNPITEGHDTLCARHLAQWQADGKPTLSAADSPVRADGGLLPVSVQAELTAERGKAQEALQLIQVLPLATSADLDLAGALVNEAAAKVKALEEQRKSVTDPLNKAVKEINGWFRPVREFYESCGTALKSRMAARLAELAAERDSALKVIEAQGAEAPAEAFALAHQSAAAPECVALVETWSYTVVNFKLLPDEYKLPNDALIKQRLRELKGDCDIPGIRIEVENKVRSKS